MNAVYRVQDTTGRGPWRPGFSARWMDADIGDRADLLPPWPNQFGFGILRQVPVGWHVGCACRDLEQLRKWFTPSEIKRLASFGYAVFEIHPDKILASSDVQLVFCRREPLNRNVIPVEMFKYE